jgi:hypothetical protein
LCPSPFTLSGRNTLTTFDAQMVFFSIFMWWAYSPNEYTVAGAKKTSIWRPLWDSINYCQSAIIIRVLSSPHLSFSRGLRPRNFWLLALLLRLHAGQTLDAFKCDEAGRSAKHELWPSFRCGPCIWQQASAGHNEQVYYAACNCRRYETKL